jgi:hypothetical protein
MGSSFLFAAAQLPGEEKMSMRSPGATVTIARFVSGRLPEYLVRHFLPGSSGCSR